jgi:1-acyl-sn-glycerol-3-phosphate acyltransferase
MTSAPAPAAPPAPETGRHRRIEGSTARPAPARGIADQVVRALCLTFLKLVGWKLRGDWPGTPKAVLLAAPHTSNWDGLLMLAAAGAYRVKLRWMGKRALVEGPFGGLVRRAGCVPVDRSAANGMVESMAEAFAAADDLVLAIAPEGSRTRTEVWKRGYWLIAARAGVPIVFSVLDFGTKTIFLSGVLHPGDDFDADWPLIRAHYAAARGKHPEKFALPA